ncbi:hypothetical protein [Streptomyces sp. NBC_01373]|uniref:hypothetical protein n=1 Tax=Streptomyces sp. NBC_01373 TaxID=2903843 RepID=UPI00225A1AD6|nr:hypothetical protein [Streptomyces sp. NBC_01373]MCX4703665.1 hypothetical protein [Streptomyces sp. NBC_01373]
MLDAVDRTRDHEPLTPGLEDIIGTLETQLTALGNGYRLGDRLLRPAHVEVTGPPPPGRQPGPTDDE